jgi:nitrate reductase cytochrome c-type subunit
MIVDILRTISHALAPVLAAAGALAAQPYDFGHRTHLTMRLECVRCHPAVPKSTQPPAAGEVTFSSDACLDCHGRAILDLKPAPQPPIAHFNHALHLALKDETCTSCHHGLLESDKVTDAVFPRMAECLACHKQVNPPQSCYLCHAKDDPRVQSQKPAPGTSQSR